MGTISVVAEYKIRCIGNENSILAMDVLCDIYTLVICNIKFSRERHENKFLTCPVLEFHVGEEVLVRNLTIDVWDPKCDVAYDVLK